MVLLEAKGIKKSFGGVRALVGADFSCDEGEIVGLLGANGSGKSTFSNIVMGLLPRDDGEIVLGGEPVRFHNPMEAIRNGVVMVHQHLSLIPDMTVWENISIGHEEVARGGVINRRASRQKAQKVLRKLDPNIDLEQKVKTLAPAEQQLVEIAKAISKDFQLLILDEPTAALEQTEVKKLFGLLHELKAEGKTMIFISHRLGEVLELCDYVVVFRNGNTVGKVEFAEDGQDEARIVSLMTGAETLQTTVAETVQPGDEVRVEVSALAAAGLHDITFNVRRGEIVGIGGLQGQGQEELLFVLSGLIAPEEGEFRVDGERVPLRHPSDAIHQGVVLVPGDRMKEGLFPHHSVFMNMIYARFGSGAPWWIPFDRYARETDEVIEALRIKTEDLETEIRKLSGGNQQKVVVGKWLPLSPKVMLLSDPAKGVDVHAKRELFETVGRLAAEGTSVILYASDNDELLTYCHRVLVMYEGQIAEEIGEADLTEDNLVAAALRARVPGQEKADR